MVMRGDARGPLQKHFDRVQDHDHGPANIMSLVDPKVNHASYIKGRDLLHDLNGPLNGSRNGFALLRMNNGLDMPAEDIEKMQERLDGVHARINKAMERFRDNAPDRMEYGDYLKKVRPVDRGSIRAVCDAFAGSMNGEVRELRALAKDFGEMPLKSEAATEEKLEDNKTFHYMGGRELRRAAYMIEDFVDTSRGFKPRKKRRPVDVNDLLNLIRSSVTKTGETQIKGKAGKYIPVESSFELVTGPKVEADEFGLEGAFDNIFRNAMDSLKMRAKKEDGKTPWKPSIDVSTSYDGSAIEVRFGDNGVGVTQSDAPGIFSSGYTTKGEGHQGAGLDIAKRTVEDHGGSIRLESPGQNMGTQFIVRLPAKHSSA